MTPSVNAKSFCSLFLVQLFIIVFVVVALVVAVDGSTTFDTHTHTERERAKERHLKSNWQLAIVIQQIRKKKKKRSSEIRKVACVGCSRAAATL